MLLSQRVRRFWRQGLLLFTLNILLIQPSYGQSASAALSLVEASQRVLNNNPQLQVFQWQLEAIDGVRQSSGLAPAYELELEADNMLGTGDLSGVRSAELALSISSVIELGGKRSARRAVGDSRYALAQAEREAKALDLLGQVTQGFIAVLVLQEKIKVAQEATELAQRSLQLVSERVGSGAAPEVERLRAQSVLVEARLEQSAFVSAFQSQMFSLATLWNAEQPDFQQVSGDLYQLSQSRSFESLYQAAVATPAIEIYASESRLRDAELQLARSQSSTNISWSLGVAHLRDSGDSAVTASLSIPLFAKQRSSGEVKAARAQIAAVESEKAVTLQSLRSRLYQAWQSRKQSVEAVAQINDQIIPLLQQALTQTRQAYGNGRYSYIEWVNTQDELLNARYSLIEAAGNALMNQALIEQLTAQPLASDEAVLLH